MPLADDLSDQIAAGNVDDGASVIRLRDIAAVKMDMGERRGWSGVTGSIDLDPGPPQRCRRPSPGRTPQQPMLY